MMNCRDFDRIWDQALDARRSGGVGDVASTARMRALAEHAARCPRCQARHHRLETLRQAIDAWAARPAARPTPSPELADWIIAAAGRPEPGGGRPRRFRWRAATLVPASAAAILLVAIGLRFQHELLQAPMDDPAPASVANEARGVRDRGLLGSVVDDATAASWQLALLASEPAARLGKGMIDDSRESASDDDALQPDGPSTMSELSILDAEPFSSDLINQMGGVLADGVRPLSASTRRAFGFLRAPTTEKPDRHSVRPSLEKGA